MKKTPLRTNVLLLIGGGYFTLLVIFIFLVLEKTGMTAEQAYDIVKSPLMALIGGSLALSKDLIQLDDHEDKGSADSLDDPGDGEGQDEKNEGNG